MNWRASLETSKAVAILGAVLGLALLVGECRNFRAASAPAAAPVVAPPTKVEAGAPAILLPCRDVEGIDPAPKDRARLAKKYHRPDLASRSEARAFELGITPPVAQRAEILGERELPPAPNGGTALVTLEPDGRVEVTVAPRPEKLFEWQSTYEAGALYGVGQGGETRGRGWVAAEPVRFARLHLRLEAGVELRAGATGGYAMAGVVWRSR